MILAACTDIKGEAKPPHGKKVLCQIAFHFARLLSVKSEGICLLCNLQVCPHFINSCTMDVLLMGKLFLIICS